MRFLALATVFIVTVHATQSPLQRQGEGRVPFDTSGDTAYAGGDVLVACCRFPYNVDATLSVTRDNRTQPDYFTSSLTLADGTCGVLTLPPSVNVGPVTSVDQDIHVTTRAVVLEAPYNTGPGTIQIIDVLSNSSNISLPPMRVTHTMRTKQSWSWGATSWLDMESLLMISQYERSGSPRYFTTQLVPTSREGDGITSYEIQINQTAPCVSLAFDSYSSFTTRFPSRSASSLDYDSIYTYGNLGGTFVSYTGCAVLARWSMSTGAVLAGRWWGAGQANCDGGDVVSLTVGDSSAPYVFASVSSNSDEVLVRLDADTLETQVSLTSGQAEPKAQVLFVPRVGSTPLLIVAGINISAFDMDLNPLGAPIPIYLGDSCQELILHEDLQLIEVAGGIRNYFFSYGANLDRQVPPTASKLTRRDVRAKAQTSNVNNQLIMISLSQGSFWGVSTCSPLVPTPVIARQSYPPSAFGFEKGTANAAALFSLSASRWGVITCGSNSSGVWATTECFFQDSQNWTPNGFKLEFSEIYQHFPQYGMQALPSPLAGQVLVSSVNGGVWTTLTVSESGTATLAAKPFFSQPSQEFPLSAFDASLGLLVLMRYEDPHPIFLVDPMGSPNASLPEKTVYMSPGEPLLCTTSSNLPCMTNWLYDASQKRVLAILQVNGSYVGQEYRTSYTVMAMVQNQQTGNFSLQCLNGSAHGCPAFDSFQYPQGEGVAPNTLTTAIDDSIPARPRLMVSVAWSTVNAYDTALFSVNLGDGSVDHWPYGGFELGQYVVQDMIAVPFTASASC